MRKLERAFYDDDITVASQTIIEVQQILSFDVRSPSNTLPTPNLADSINTTQDGGLLRYMYQHIASTYLWSSLVAHRHASPEKLINDVSDPVHVALNVLRHHVLLKLSIPIKGSPRQILADTQNMPSKPNTSSRSRAPPKTPKRNCGLLHSCHGLTHVSVAGTVKRSPPTASTTVAPQRSTALQFDEFQHLDRQIGRSHHFLGETSCSFTRIRIADMLSQVLGALGLILLKLEVLHARRALNEAHAQTRCNDGDDIPLDVLHIGSFRKFFVGFVRISIDLAQEYAILGRMDRAGGMYAEALAAVEDSDHSISTETRLRLYLRLAEATVTSGNTEESLVAYAKASALADVLTAEPIPSGILKTLHRVGALERAALASHAFSAIQACRVRFHVVLIMFNMDNYGSFPKENFVSSLDGLLQALRLWNRAAEMLSRLNKLSPPPPHPRGPATASPNPFEVSELPDDSSMPDRMPNFDGLQWRIIGVRKYVSFVAHFW